MRDDYRVLRVRRCSDPGLEARMGIPDHMRFAYHSDQEGPLVLDDIKNMYSEGRFDGLLYHFDASVKQPDLDVVRHLRDLRYVEVQGRVRDDTAVFDVPTLEEIALLTRSKRPIFLGRSSSVRRLAIDDRPGLNEIGECSGQIQDIRICLWRGSDLEFLRGTARLARVEIEGKRQVTALAGLEGCRLMGELTLKGVRVEDLAPLQGAAYLTHLEIIGYPGVATDSVLELSHLQGLRRLRKLVLTYQPPLASLRPLLDLPSLESVWLRGSKVKDGDLSPLTELRRAGVGARGPDE